MRKAVHFFPVLMMAGCASLSADNCAVADWDAAGYADGARGQPFDAIAGRPASCPAYAAADIGAYLAGVSEGVAAYCDASTAFAMGASGDPYFGVCTGPEGDVFEAAYGMGRRLFALRQANTGIEATIADVRAEIWEVKQREAAIEASLGSTSTRRAERLEYRAELKSLADDRARLEAQVASMAEGFMQAENELEDYRSRAPMEAPEGGVLRPIQASY